MTTETETILSIRSATDVVLARARCEKLALDIGMTKAQVADVATAVTELASNLLKHRVTEGKVIIRVMNKEGSKGLEVISSDMGPGIADIDLAMADGSSTAGSLGIGLPAVNRLMDEFEIRSNIAEGTLITTRKWVKCDLSYVSLPEIELSVFSRPLSGQKYNGDAYFIKRYEDKVVFAVIDGLGHGQDAQVASHASVDCLENCYRRPFAEIFQACHKRLKKTRGAAMSLCRINLGTKIMTHAGVGNVDTRVYSSETVPRPFCINGTLGVAMRTVKVDEYPLPEHYAIIMFSDGVSGRFSPDSLRGFPNLKPQILAKQIMDNHARDNDDATIIVGRSSL